jgi:Fur family transcriptional regulator, peroxide stress response regulator
LTYFSKWDKVPDIVNMQPDRITQRLKDFEALCRRLGVPLTVQRRVVLQTVLERDDHPTADQILETVKDRVPGISRTTVYRVLDTLADMGVIRRLHHAGAAARYDGKIHRHHHMICKKCNKVIDLEDQKLDRTRVSHVSNEEFEIEDFSVHLIGTCSACRQAKVERTHD